MVGGNLESVESTLHLRKREAGALLAIGASSDGARGARGLLATEGRGDGASEAGTGRSWQSEGRLRAINLMTSTSAAASLRFYGHTLSYPVSAVGGQAIGQRHAELAYWEQLARRGQGIWPEATPCNKAR